MGALHRLLALAGFALGCALLILQATLTIPLRMEQGDSVLRSVVFLFSYFTILANLGVTVVYLAALTGWRGLSALRRPAVRTMMAAFITIVMMVYHLVLAAIWAPEGLMKLADQGLHYAAPILYLAWWLLGPHEKPIRFAKAAPMLLVPLSYAAYALIRGALTGRYPYPFLDVPSLGHAAVAVNVAGLCAVFAVTCLLAIAISRAMHRIAPQGLL